jgi:hypothetical protein
MVLRHEGNALTAPLTASEIVVGSPVLIRQRMWVLHQRRSPRPRAQELLI